MKAKFKPVPSFLNDAAAEQFVEKADLSAYDLSDFKPMDFVLEPKAVALNVRSPQNVLDSDGVNTVRACASADGIKNPATKLAGTE